MDPAGDSYPGTAIFFSQIAPNYQSTQKGPVYIPPGALENIGQGSTLDIKFHGTSPVPFEAVWGIDLINLTR
jgi:hypothetical protein